MLIKHFLPKHNNCTFFRCSRFIFAVFVNFLNLVYCYGPCRKWDMCSLVYLVNIVNVFFWYRLTRVVPTKSREPKNDCSCSVVVYLVTACWTYFCLNWCAFTVSELWSFDVICLSSSLMMKLYLLLCAHGHKRFWEKSSIVLVYTHTTVLLLFCNLSGTTRVSRYQKGKTRKVKTNLDLLGQEIVSGSDICWAICKSAPHPRQPHPTSHHSVFYRPDALPAAQPTASKHWRKLLV